MQRSAQNEARGGSSRDQSEADCSEASHGLQLMTPSSGLNNCRASRAPQYSCLARWLGCMGLMVQVSSIHKRYDRSIIAASCYSVCQEVRGCHIGFIDLFSYC